MHKYKNEYEKITLHSINPDLCVYSYEGANQSSGFQIAADRYDCKYLWYFKD